VKLFLGKPKETPAQPVRFRGDDEPLSGSVRPDSFLSSSSAIERATTASVHQAVLYFLGRTCHTREFHHSNYSAVMGLACGWSWPHCQYSSRHGSHPLFGCHPRGFGSRQSHLVFTYPDISGGRPASARRHAGGDE